MSASKHAPLRGQLCLASYLMRLCIHDKSRVIGIDRAPTCSGSMWMGRKLDQTPSSTTRRPTDRLTAPQVGAIEGRPLSSLAYYLFSVLVLLSGREGKER